MKITGLHHITAVCSDAERTVDFYTGVLGLRLVKQTVNFDAPESYHLYFGNTNDPDGHIVELATAGPGFAFDEPVESLGTSLKLPPWLESYRVGIAGKLKPLVVEE